MTGSLGRAGTPRELSGSERLDWLRLARSENVGPRTFSMLLARYGSAGAALDALPGLVGRRGGRPIALCTAADAERELAGAGRLGVKLVALCEPAYPVKLRTIDAPPPIIGVQGSAEVLSRPTVAIVGSRNASATGLVLADRLARGLSSAGYLVVSGLARGIDAKAHLGSLDAGTVAVLAGGHDRIYPSEHLGLARRIAETGALVSEMPLGWEPRARDFPRRNRLVSGLSLGVIVVEAGRRSGSLITARFANDQGREVFAVPGSPLDARAEGANELIRQGATLCTRIDDVLDALAPLMGSPRRVPALSEPDAASIGTEPLWEEIDLLDPTAGGEAASRAEPPEPDFRRSDAQPEVDGPSSAMDGVEEVVALLGPTPVTVDELIRASSLPARQLQAVLTELELGGRVRRLDGNRVALAL